HSHDIAVNAERECPKREQAAGLRLVPRPEQEFSGFLEAAPDAVVIADVGGQIIRVNAQAEKLFGYSRAELLGREVETLKTKGTHLNGINLTRPKLTEAI